MEIEVKLLARPGELSNVMRAVAEVASVVREPAVKRLESRYYDTPCRKLLKSGMSLRVRRVGGGFVQTVKTEADGGFARGEWEKPVASFAPEMDGACDALAEVFVTEIERNKMIVCFPAWRSDPSRIELALDTGIIRAGGRVLPVNEAELELIEGSTADVLDLGARLAEMLPLQLSLDSKSARGYRLADNATPSSAKADKLEFPDHVSLEDGMRESLLACIRQWLANQASAFDGRDAEGVHQMRVALRRLRSAIQFFRDFIPEPPFKEFRDQSKWAANCLGPARDWDVFLLETLPPVMELWPEHRGLRALYDEALRMRDDGYTQARVAMTSPAYTVFALRLAGWVERSGWRVGLCGDQIEAMQRPMTDHAGHLLDRLYHRAMDAGDGFDDLDSEAKHELRIALKKLRYAGEFFRSLYPRKDVRKFRDALTAMLELLGKLNDLTVAKHLCGHLMDLTKGDETLASGAATLVTFHQQRGHVSDKALSMAWDNLCGADPFWRD
ncbi:CYTH and CHAD domain-containing protein [Emcibacter sp. SYSU 3D8]|uniref:CYTH and CHAD domain-containing protein n=1 Tax=Emcibacter sp. SYSU 3D8 TaxID=3133969 RepID=UPI0031FE5CE0